jgi:hypothetical protein
MKDERLPLIIWDQVDVVSELIDRHGSLFLPKPTATMVFNVSSPPKYGSSLRDSFTSRSENAPVTRFLSLSTNYTDRILTSTVATSDKAALEAALRYLEDYARVSENMSGTASDQAQELPEGDALAKEITKLQEQLDIYVSADEATLGSNVPSLPLSRAELAILNHSLSLAKEAASLPHWTVVTQKQVAGVAALLEQIQPMIEPISQPLKEVWNSVLESLKTALSALQFPKEAKGRGDPADDPNE